MCHYLCSFMRPFVKSILPWHVRAIALLNYDTRHFTFLSLNKSWINSHWKNPSITISDYPTSDFISYFFQIQIFPFFFFGFLSQSDSISIIFFFSTKTKFNSFGNRMKEACTPRVHLLSRDNLTPRYRILVALFRIPSKTHKTRITRGHVYVETLIA